jgi:hypothetical protein
MSKYKQTVIPNITTNTKENNIAFVKKYYTENLQGKSVVNQHLGITIRFNSEGKKELAYGRALYKKKIAVIKCLQTLLQIAEYTGWGQRKASDEANVLGYMKFKAKVNIDNVPEYVHIAVYVTNDLKAYYSHEINKKMS